MAHNDVAAHHSSADDEYRATPPGAGHEHTDASVWIIAKFLFWLTISALVIHVGMGGMYALLIERSNDLQEAPYPLASAEAQRQPPVPRLQQFPRNELYQFRVGEESMLQNYGWINQEAGSVHIPISEAMRLVVERGLPARTPEPQQADQGPGMMPSDSSSGRTMERRRQ